MIHYDIEQKQIDVIVEALKAYQKQIEEHHKDVDGVPQSLEKAHVAYELIKDLENNPESDLGVCFENVLQEWDSGGVLEALDGEFVEDWVVDNSPDITSLLNRFDPAIIKEYYKSIK